GLLLPAGACSRPVPSVDSAPSLGLGTLRSQNGRLLAVLGRATTEAEWARSPAVKRTRTRLSRRVSHSSSVCAADGAAVQQCAPSPLRSHGRSQPGAPKASSALSA